jgi:RNA polymerase sigma factor (sigma-70 family)
MSTAAAVTTAAAVAATASAPHDPLSSIGGRPHRAAAVRTEELYAQFGRTVGGLCRALLRDAGEAEDAAQQTFLSAHRALLNGSRPREPAAWLATIARNECWARIKARMREPLPSDALETRVAGATDPVAEALRRADLAALWGAIDALPPVQRDALLLREFGGLSYGELAAALAVSEPAVESLLFRARRRLRVQLRAVFAAFTGASWLEALARLVAGGAPAGAKVAALGVGRRRSDRARPSHHRCSTTIIPRRSRRPRCGRCTRRRSRCMSSMSRRGLRRLRSFRWLRRRRSTGTTESAAGTSPGRGPRTWSPGRPTTTPGRAGAAVRTTARPSRPFRRRLRRLRPCPPWRSTTTAATAGTAAAVEAATEAAAMTVVTVVTRT